jgi:hypothetical protein
MLHMHTAPQVTARMTRSAVSELCGSMHSASRVREKWPALGFVKMLANCAWRGTEHAVLKKGSECWM